MRSPCLLVGERRLASRAETAYLGYESNVAVFGRASPCLDGLRGSRRTAHRRTIALVLTDEPKGEQESSGPGRGRLGWDGSRDVPTTFPRPARPRACVAIRPACREDAGCSGSFVRRLGSRRAAPAGIGKGRIERNHRLHSLDASIGHQLRVAGGSPSTLRLASSPSNAQGVQRRVRGRSARTRPLQRLVGRHAGNKILDRGEQLFTFIRVRFRPCGKKSVTHCTLGEQPHV